MKSQWNDIDKGKPKKKNGKNPYPSATLSTTNPHMD
jgi:hypothetical protein